MAKFYYIVMLLTILLFYMVGIVNSTSVQRFSNEIKTDKNNKAPCQQNYSPCSCTSSFGTIITCTGIDLEEVRQVFIRTSAAGAQRSDDFYLTLPKPLNDNDILIIPPDLMNNQTAGYISITCPTATADRKYQLEADLESFRSNRQSTTSFSIIGCDLNLLNLNFLAGFENLSGLFFDYSTDVQTSLMSLPVLPALSDLAFGHCPDFGSTNSFPTLSNGIALLSLNDNGWNDERMSRILDWILESSIDSLLELFIYGDALTVPPQQITRFTRLNFLWLRDNTAPLTLKRGSLSFQFPVYVLDVSNNPQLIVEAEAFQGNFAIANVNLDSNNLTLFEESVFYPVLQNMPIYGRGYVSVDKNPFDCDDDICHLAWLILDNPQYLPYVYSGRCSNGTPFERLRQNDFINCP